MYNLPFATKDSRPSIEEIIASKLLAKVVFELNGKVMIVAVFEKSDYYKFFHTFTARTRRTPRKNWKYTKLYYTVNAGMGKTHLSMEDFISQHFPQAISPKVTYSRPIKKRDYLIWHRRIALPFEEGLRPMIVSGSTFEYANSRTSGKRRPWGNYKKLAYRGGK
jgi:hypothetical protein